MNGDGLAIRSVRVRSVVAPMRRALITCIVIIEKAAFLLIDLETPVTVEDGHVLIPDTPGAGIAWNEDAVEKYSVTF